jgi:hypothetical protein
MHVAKDVFLMPLDRLQPSQLFISAQKLAAVRKGGVSIRRLEPVPVKRLGRSLVMTDGHTRAVAAALRGLAHVRVVWETDRLDWDMYRICVRWCRRAGIRTVHDLASRIVPHADYERLWHDRCSRMQVRVRASRARRGAPLQASARGRA